MPRIKKQAKTFLIFVIGLSVTGCAGVRSPQLSTPSSSADLPFTGSSAPLNVQLEGYVRAQEALASDNFNDARIALQELTDLADPVTQPLIRSAAAADNIVLMRTRFKPLSEYLGGLDLPQGFSRAYCPMYDNGSNWVQRDGPVRNPYYGSEMLTCGVVDAAPGAHMDHSPRHDGIVFMAPDSFHHIEGAYPEKGVFRLYATDNYREAVDMSGWSGRVVLEEDYDPDTDEFIEVVAHDLVPSPDGDFLEALIGDRPAPTEVTAKVIFVEDFPEERFDFIFGDYSGIESAANSTVMTGAPSSVPLADRIRPPIPELTSDIVTSISNLDQELASLIDRGAFAEIFIPALQAKSLALALNDRTEGLNQERRDSLQIAVRHLVRASWLLDWYGDLGNRQQVTGAFNIFSGATSEIKDVFEDNSE